MKLESLLRIARPAATAWLICTALPAGADDKLPTAHAEPLPAKSVLPPLAASARTVRLGAFDNDLNDPNSAGYRLVLSCLVSRTDSLLGVELAPVDDVLRAHLGLDDGKGLLVTEVKDDGPGAKAGLKRNDVLKSIDNADLANIEQFNQCLLDSVDKPVKITVVRAGKQLVIEATPHQSLERDLALKAAIPHSDPDFWLGVGLAPVDETLRSHLAIPAGEGLVVTSIEDGSPALRAGVMMNDILLKLNGKGLVSLEALSAQLQGLGEKSVALEVLRRGQPAMFTVTPARRPVPEFDISNDVVVVRSPAGLKLLTFQQAQQPPFVYNVTDFAMDFSAPPPTVEFTRQIANLREQVQALEKSLDALEAAVKPGAPAAAPLPDQQQPK